MPNAAQSNVNIFVLRARHGVLLRVDGEEVHGARLERRDPATQLRSAKTHKEADVDERMDPEEMRRPQAPAVAAFDVLCAADATAVAAAGGIHARTSDRVTTLLLLLLRRKIGSVVPRLSQRDTAELTCEARDRAGI